MSTDPGYICERCHKLCDTVEVSEFETEEVCGATETHEVKFLVSQCCNEGVEPTRDGAYGEIA